MRTIISLMLWENLQKKSSLIYYIFEILLQKKIICNSKKIIKIADEITQCCWKKNYEIEGFLEFFKTFILKHYK